MDDFTFGRGLRVCLKIWGREPMIYHHFQNVILGHLPFLAKQTSSRGIATASLMDVEVAFQDVCAICGN